MTRSSNAGPAPETGGTLASYDTLSYDGVSAASVSLYWAQSTDGSFVDYLVQVAAQASGPWTTLWSTQNIALTGYCASGFGPGGTDWFQVVDEALGSTQASNQLRVTQTPLANLSYSAPNATAAQFSWNNPANYGGNLSFSSYGLFENRNGSDFTSVATVRSASTTTYTIHGLSSGAIYGFFVQTTDNCGGMPSPTNSNTVLLDIPAKGGGTAGGGSSSNSEALALYVIAGVGVAIVVGVVLFTRIRRK